MVSRDGLVVWGIVLGLFSASLTLLLSTSLFYWYIMLEQFLIFTKGGLILFQSGAAKLNGEPVANLVQNILLEVGASSFAIFVFWLLSC